MNSLARQFFSAGKESVFTSVRILSEEPNLSWDEVDRLTYNIPRGWFELSRISARDRVEFTRDYWLDRMPYHPSANAAFFEFFEGLDDVAVVLYRKMEEEPMEVELVYSLADNSSFFRGKTPATDAEIAQLKEDIGCNLPRDFLSFLKIHNGFGKLSEMGLIEAQDMADSKRKLVDLIMRSEKRINIDPRALNPFFEALGLSSFQCFYADWYPGSEMGNVYFSGIDYTISDLSQKKAGMENLAFPTFSEWLKQYLEGMNLCT